MPLTPPLAPMFPTRKYLGHVCPSRQKILGTPLKSAHVFMFRGWGKFPLSPTGAHVLHQEMSWNLVPLWFNSPGYATAVNSHFHMFERGPVPLVLPPLAPMSPTRKYVRHVCPSSLKILGTPLKSAHGLNSRRGLGQVPLSPAQGRPCPPPGIDLASCASLV